MATRSEITFRDHRSSLNLMAVSSQGKLQEFDGQAWSSWAERLGLYFETNGVTEVGKKRALQLELCGASTYETVRAPVAPRKLGEVSFDESVNVLQAHFDPRPPEYYSRSKFQRRDQAPGKSIT